MSTITYLSDAQLDAVTGGLLNFSIGTGINLNGQASGQNNQAFLVLVAGQGGQQNTNNVQNTGNFSGNVNQS